MATQTIPWSTSYALDANLVPLRPLQFVTVEYDFDDVANRVTRVRANVPGAWPLLVWISRTDGTQRRQTTVAAGGSLDLAITTGASTRIQLTVNAKGRRVGMEGGVEYPAPAS